MSKARSLADLISGGATIEASEIADSTITGGKLASDIVINTTGTVTTSQLNLGDDDVINVGAGNDLQIYHDASNSYIKDAGTGDLRIEGGFVRLVDTANGGTTATFASSGVNLRHNNSVKLTTVSNGIDVTGRGKFTGTSNTAGIFFDNSDFNSDSDTFDWEQYQNSSGQLVFTITGSGGAEMTLRNNNTASYTNAELFVGGYLVATTDNTLNLSNKTLISPTITGNVAFDTNTLYVDATNNRVGIGTTSPEVGLDFQMINSEEGFRVRRHNASSQYIEISETDGSRHEIKAVGDKEFRIFNEAPSNSTTFYTNSTERMRIDQSGNVGIGTTSPGAILDIKTTDTASLVDALHLDNPNAAGGGVAVSFLQNNNRKARIKSYFNASTQWNIGFDTEDTTDALTIIDNGNIGIGTTSPDELVHISTGTGLTRAVLKLSAASDQYLTLRSIHNGTTSEILSGYGLDLIASGSNDLRFYTNSSFRMVVNGSGNVGIGTSSPTQKLDVSGTVKATAFQGDGSALTGTGSVAWGATVKTSSFTAVSGNGYFVDTTSSAVIVTLPASPSAGDNIGIIDYAGTFNSNNCTIDANGNKIEGSTDVQVIQTNRTGLNLIFIDSTQGWLVSSEGSSDPITAPEITWDTAAGTVGTITDSQRSGGYSLFSCGGSANIGSPTFSITSGALPTGLSISSSGVISGTVTNPVASNTVFNFTVTATISAYGYTETRDFSVTVNAPVITFNTASGSIGTVEDNQRSNGSYSLSSVTATVTSGSLTYAVTTGSLPGSVSLNSSTGAITGNFDTVESDTVTTFTITATEGTSSVTAARQFSIQVNSTIDVSYILVAGGAGGGSGNGFFGAGGGGAGGLLTGTISDASGNYTVSIGGGGSGAGGTARGGNGGNSSISGVATAIGGGGGAAVSTGAGGNKHGASGGSGGGGGHDSGSGSGGSGTSGQGNNGGNGQQDGGGGGGGGKGSAGSAGGSGGGAGGTGGQYSTIASATSSGDNGYYASGGSGGNNGTAQDGGGGASGGGGQGNTGGGGGKQASGGSGICIMYYTASSQLASGGSVTNSGGVYYHKFTSGGTFSI